MSNPMSSDSESVAHVRMEELCCDIPIQSDYGGLIDSAYVSGPYVPITSGISSYDAIIQGTKSVSITRAHQKNSTWTKGKELGSGGFGYVYEWTNTEGEVHAVKEVNLSGEIKLDALENEIEMLGTLQHANVIKYFFRREDDEKLYMHMELMKMSLQRWLNDNGKMSDEKACDWARQILNGLIYLHENDIIHRDIKPDNILMDDEQKTMKLTDMGLSEYHREITGNFDVDETAGTYRYKAPEVLFSKQGGKRADVWSFGCTVFAMVTGIPPIMKKLRGNNTQLMTERKKCEVAENQYLGQEVKILLGKIFVEMDSRPYAIDLNAEEWLKEKNVEEKP